MLYAERISQSFGAVDVLVDVSFTVADGGNVGGGRTEATDARVELVAIGADTAKYVSVQSILTRAVGLSLTALAAQERNFNNP